MWKITTDQYEEVRTQEGRSWYDLPISLGEDEDGTPINTITNSQVLKNILAPSDSYKKTIVEGLRETYPKMSEAEIVDYIQSRITNKEK